MWAAFYNTPRCQPTLHRSKAEANKWTGVVHSVRVTVIPLDDCEAIVERAAKALCNRKDDETWKNLHWDNQEIYRDAVSAALTAAGIPCKRKASK